MLTKLFNPKKAYFNGMLKDLQKVIWNQELKRFKALGAREQYRREYDQVQTYLQPLQAKYESTKDEETKKQIDEAEAKIAQLKAAMDDMDKRIHGEQPDSNGEGIIGITQELEASIENREYIKAFVKHNT